VVSGQLNPILLLYNCLVGFFRNLKVTLEMIKWEHSIFALPFALCGAMLAAGGLPAWRQLAWIVVAMVSARSAAMAFNRLADVSIDAANPRDYVRSGVMRNFCSCGFAVEPLDADAFSGSACGHSSLLLHQAIHALVTSVSRIRAWYCSCCGLDRGAWIA
jgi:4-hydroxybenzoate polyprenyltransferase